MLNSLKQLIRTPFKSLLFLLLMIASTILLIFGAVMLVEANQRINDAEAEFTTIGTVEQQPDRTQQEIVPENDCFPQLTLEMNIYEQVWTPEVLQFGGAAYILEPVVRPYYMAYLPGINSLSVGTVEFSSYILEFTPLADCTLEKGAEVKITRILLNKETDYDVGRRERAGYEDPALKIGSVITLCDHTTQEPTPLKAEKTYICTVVSDIDYTVGPAPFSSQYGAEDGKILSSAAVRSGRESVPIEDRFDYFAFYSYPDMPAVQEVTSDFWKENGQGKLWLEWVKAHEQYDNTFLVHAANGLQLIPEFHESQVYISQGREITAEEFESGALVCMVSKEFAVSNRLLVGDKITLPLHYALYGYLPDRERTYASIAIGYRTFHRGYSPLNADGKLYEPFWEAEYEIVGTYEPLAEGTLFCGESSLAKEMFIIPAKSVGASDENNIAHYGAMNALNTSFQIQNGTIQEFDSKLRAAVPESADLVITYDDNGYSEVMNDLQNARLTAFLLCAVGVLSTLGIVILLLFFFVVRQKKRTAIERSLGMTRLQCVLSLLAGILILTLLAVAVGSACSAVLIHSVDLTGSSGEPVFDTMYSLWANGQTEFTGEPEAASIYLYFSLPALILLITGVLALILVQQNLKIEPILLLSVKG